MMGFLNAIKATASQDAAHVHFVGTISDRTPQRPNGTTRHYPSRALDGLVKSASQFAGRLDTYVAPAYFEREWYWEEYQDKNTGETKRRKRWRTADNALGASCFWVDIDCGAGKAAEGKGYIDRKAAIDALVEWYKAVGLDKPNVLVNSGGGIHAYWTFERFIEKAEWTALAESLKALTQNPGGDIKPLRADGSRTADIASFMRMPGTTHLKDPSDPKPVEVLRILAHLDFDKFAARLREAAPGRAMGAGEQCETDDLGAGMPTSKGQPSMKLECTPENVAFVLRALEAARLSQDTARGEWMPTVWSIMSLGEGWQDVARDWSRQSSRYSDAGFDNVAGSYEEGKSGFEHVLRLARANGFTEQPPVGQEDEAPPLRVVDLADVLTADISGPEFIVDRLIPRGHATLFGGHGESGKTYIALALGVHVALGVPWAGLATQRGRVLFVSLEDDGEIMRYRLRRVIEGHMMQAHFHNIAANLRIIDGHDSGPMVTEFADAGVRRIMPTKVYESVKSEVEQFKPDLLIIDNASDAFDGDENNRRQVRQFIKRLVALGKEQDTAVILLAHISKGAAQYGSAGNSYSGSTQWHNSVRSRIAIIDGKLVHEKSNHGAKLDCEIPLVWQNGCWKPDRNGEIQAEQRARANETDDGHVYAAIAAVIWQGGEVRAADSGPYTTWHAISGRAELPDDLRADTREAKRRVKEAAHRLADAGRIRKEEFIASGRNKSYRWVLVEPESVA